MEPPTIADLKKSKVSDSETDSPSGDDRGHWHNSFEFLLSTLGYAIGTGSLWRFPYMAVRNGGGAFLIPYVIFALIFGFPLFFMESALGQYFQQSPIRVFDICPLFKGIGLVMCVVSVLVPVYYMTLLAWALYFLYSAFSAELPWVTCGNTWNTNSCMPIGFQGNYTFNASGLIFTKPVLSTEEFWENQVLGLTNGIEEPGEFQRHLALSLFLGWVIVFICICKGIDSSRIAVYFTATVPFILLIVLCAWTATFPGAGDGMLLYITPRWEKMRNYQVWVEAFIQVFGSLGPAWGGIITLSSYNPFRNNCIRDAIVVTLADTVTAIFCGFVMFSGLGYMAHETGVDVLKVFREGPGLSFVTYPQVVATMPLPQFWASLFFLLVFLLGIDSVFGMIKTTTSGLFDLYPNTLGKRKVLVTLTVCVTSYLVGLIFVSGSGMYRFHLTDWYLSFFSLMTVALLECLVVSYLYGVNRFLENVTEMLGWANKYFLLLMKYTWMFEIPIVMAVVFIFTIATFRSPTYGSYKYPDWTNIFGWLLAISLSLPIPIVMIYSLLTTQGSLRERFRNSIRPRITRKGGRIEPDVAQNGHAQFTSSNYDNSTPGEMMSTRF